VKHFYDITGLEAQRRNIAKRYLEFLRIPAMSAGIYVLSAGETDPQSPHKQDEMYYVVRGRARMSVGGETQLVSAGSVVFVEAGLQHRFHDIEEELTILVFFAPAESE
jgi:mannose-6-phosphate isomerase-like protein (cupin superfamily)